MSVNLKSLIGRLNDTCRQALEGAAGLCLSRTNYDVEVEHVLLKILEAPDTDFLKILRRFEIDASRFAKDVTRALDRLKTGNARTPALSPRLPRLIEKAWVVASIEYGASRVRSGHLLLVLLTDDDLSRLTREISKDLAGISVEQLTKTFADVVKGSAEDREAQALASAPGAAGGPDVAMGVPGKTKALDLYTEDLTAKARAGKIDPILGRDFEIRQVIDILTRRRQNNPILTGEAGVGKTAVVEGFAQRIVQGDVPGPLKNVVVRTLDLGLLQAGAGIKGEFENRLKQVIDEVKAAQPPIIIFIDEAHTMIGAGGSAGQNDAANLLKPALARGELRTIAATTWAEYKKYFEKDAALARRFQVVKVEEPTEEIAIVMMRALAKNLEKHHGGLRILDEAVESSVKLSHRYITGRQLPDKCVSVLDTACAKVNISQAATPAPIEDCRRRIDQLTAEIEALEREAAVGANHSERIEKSKAAKAESEARLAVLDEQCKKEIETVNRIKEVRGKLEAAVGGTANPDFEVLRAEMACLNAELVAIQGDTPMMQPHVNAQAVAEIIAGWTGIPVGRMQADEIETVRNLAQAPRRAGRRPGPRPRRDRAEDPDLPRRPHRPAQADRRLHARRDVRRRQDRDRHRPRRDPLRRRAEHGHDQHVRVPGSPHRLVAEGLPPGLRRLRRRRRPHRGRAAQALLRRPPRRGREGAPRRPRALLPGLRQGADGGRRGARDRLQELRHPPDDERRVGRDDEDVRRPGDGPDARRRSSRRSSRASTRSSSRPSSGACRSSRTTRSRKP